MEFDERVLLFNIFGALVAGCIGIWRAYRSMKDVLVRSTRRELVVAPVVGVTIMLVLALRCTPADMLVRSQNASMVLSMYFAPSLMFIPGSMFCIALAFWREEVALETRKTSLTVGATDFACRLTWMSFWYATAVIIPGYVTLIIYWNTEGYSYF
jgi:hypothetical protein